MRPRTVAVAAMRGIRRPAGARRGPTPKAPVFRVHPGVTLTELLIALVIFGVIMVGAFGMLHSQIAAFARGADRMNLLQNFRYAANVLEKDLRTAGSGVPLKQPYLVYAGPDLIAINVDYMTNDANDVFAIYSDTAAPDELVHELTEARRFTFPGTLFQYPDTSYGSGPGLVSPAETILFFFAPDSTTTRTDDYVLYRQVNDAAMEIVARNLLRTDSLPFFEYVRIVAPPDTQAWLEDIAADDLPLAHAAPIHGSPTDTGRLAVIDSIRAVRVHFTATNGMTGEDERTGAISRLIRLRNAGLAAPRTCGDEPLMTTSIAAVPVTIAGTGESAIELSWDPVADDGHGEGDVVRYVLWKRTATEVEWGDPFMSLPAGETSYLYVDPRVEPGVTYTYALAAQDCTPSLSGLTASSPVTVPGS
ncbi:MAG TPA: prepilin-type N-terminal cleavage/methylation domain-containing protein [Longimicrobiales bacterium]